MTTWPDQSASMVRSQQDEIETLRQELGTSEAACASAMAEVEALTEERDKLQFRLEKLKQTVDAFPDANDAANLAHARSQRDDFAAENRRLRTAAQHVVDLYRQGNLMGTVVAVARLGEVLDGGT